MATLSPINVDEYTDPALYDLENQGFEPAGADWMATVEEEQPWFSYTMPAGIKVQVSGTQHYDPARQVKLETAYRRWRDASGTAIVKVAPLSLRQTFPAEMETLLQKNGFALVQRYGGWDFTPFRADSELLICLCRSAAKT